MTTTSPRRGRRTCRVIMGGLAALAGLGACGNDDPEGYGPEVRRDFVEQCTDAGTPEGICGCFYDRVAAEIPFERYEEIDAAIREGGEVPSNVSDLAVTCAAEQGATG